MGMNIHQPTTHFKILLQHMFKGRFLTFSFATPNKEWIFLLPKMTLMDIVIVDLIRTNMVQRMSTMTIHATSDDGCSRHDPISNEH
jgi:hypothetical protein